MNISPKLRFVKTSEEKLTVDTVIVGRVADDGVLPSFGQVVLAVNLILAAIHGRRSRPDINVVLAVVIVGDLRYVSSISLLMGGNLTALLAIILVATVLGQEGQVHNLADVQLTRSCRDRDWVIISAGALVLKSVLSSKGLGRQLIYLQQHSSGLRSRAPYQVQEGCCRGSRRKSQ